MPTLHAPDRVTLRITTLAGATSIHVLTLAQWRDARALLFGATFELLPTLPELPHADHDRP